MNIPMRAIALAVGLGALWSTDLGAQAPPNAAAKLDIDRTQQRISLSYNGAAIFTATLAIAGPSGERSLDAAGVPILTESAHAGARGIRIAEETKPGDRDSITQKVT